MCVSFKYLCLFCDPTDLIQQQRAEHCVLGREEFIPTRQLQQKEHMAECHCSPSFIHSFILQTPIYPYKLLHCLSTPQFTAFLLLLCQISWDLLKLQIMLWGRGLRQDRHFLSPKGRNWQLIFASRSFLWGRLIKPDEN